MSDYDQVPIHPRRALLDVADTIPENTVVACDVGNTASMARPYFEFEHPCNFITSHPYAGIGYGWPAALGAQLARPNDRAIAICGDGGFSTAMMETLTAVRYNIPATACVFNNMQWGAEMVNQLEFYGERTVGSELPENPDFAELARDMGAQGIRVEEPDEIIPAVDKALNADRPSVINIIVDPDEMIRPHRMDALEKPERKQDKYKQPGDPNY
jgi:sulfoacetaldehyde acetyltransferase